MNECPKLVNNENNIIIEVNNSSFSIGRALSCNHVVERIGISRLHCIIKKTNDKWILFDKSTNGTFVNSRLYKNNQSVHLCDGDVIKLDMNDAGIIFTQKPVKEEPSLFPKEEAVYEEKAALLAESIEKRCESEQKQENLEMMEDELTCSICSELFVKAVTLNCSHTYCKSCIQEWRKSKSSCPICRKYITSVSPTLVLDNFIEKIISRQSDQVKKERQELIKVREELGAEAGSSTNKVPNESVIEISEDDEDNDTDYNDMSDDHDYGYDDGYDVPYFGGYGRCYICNEEGHWANGCPFKRR